MNFKIWLENQHYFHGTAANFDQFSYNFLGTGRGYDQEGPGFYFTSDEHMANLYASMWSDTGRVIKASLNIRRPIPLKGTPKYSEILKLIQAAPHLSEHLTDWDEDPKIALQQASESIMLAGNPHKAFQTVWYDFYYRSGDTVDYLKNMLQLGYDGVIIPQTNGETIAVVFDPKNISILNN